jgi:hypothetical protein
MAKKNREQKLADLRELPKEAIAAVLIAEIAQIKTDGGTHPDPDARERIKRGSDRLWAFIEGHVTSDIVAKLPRIQDILGDRDTGQLPRPVIICLCGSARFDESFREANLQETLAGKIVLTVGCDFKSDSALGPAPEVKERLDALHLQKIALADEVLILNVNGYIGESTARELRHAIELGKEVRFLEPDKAPR